MLEFLTTVRVMKAVVVRVEGHISLAQALAGAANVMVLVVDFASSADTTCRLA